MSGRIRRASFQSCTTPLISKTEAMLSTWRFSGGSASFGASTLSENIVATCTPNPLFESSFACATKTRSAPPIVSELIKKSTRLLPILFHGAHKICNRHRVCAPHRGGNEAIHENRERIYERTHNVENIE